MERYRRHSWRSKSRPHSSVPGNITGLLCFKQRLAPRTECTPGVKCSANRLSASALGREPNLATRTPPWHDDCNGDGLSLRKRKYYRATFLKSDLIGIGATSANRGYLGKFEVGLFEGAGDLYALRALPDFPPAVLQPVRTRTEQPKLSPIASVGIGLRNGQRSPT